MTYTIDRTFEGEQFGKLVEKTRTALASMVLAF